MSYNIANVMYVQLCIGILYNIMHKMCCTAHARAYKIKYYNNCI